MKNMVVIENTADCTHQRNLHLRKVLTSESEETMSKIDGCTANPLAKKLVFVIILVFARLKHRPGSKQTRSAQEWI